MSEVWKDVVDYEGLYQVSDLGRVKALPREIENGRGWGYTRPGYIMKCSVIRRPNNIRPMVKLSKAGRSRSHQVHRLVLEAFRGPCPPGMECCHNDGNPQNNRLDNLRWDTHQNNCTDQVRHGTLARGERSGNAKLTVELVRSIRAAHEAGASTRELADAHGMRVGTVWGVVSRRSWAWLDKPEWA